MTFLNASLILGGLAVAIPIALHLLSRRQPKRVVFPSIGLLRNKASLTQSRAKIKKWWLLAARIALILLLALTLAQPMIGVAYSTTWISVAAMMLLGISLLAMASVAKSQNQQRSFVRGLAMIGCLLVFGSTIWSCLTLARSTDATVNLNVPQAVAIIIDNGPSAAWTDRRGQHLERIKRVGESFIDGLPDSSQICMIDRSTKTATFTLDKNRSKTKLRQLEVIESPRPIEEQFAIASQVLKTSNLESKLIFCVSGLTEFSWNHRSSADEKPVPIKLDEVNLTIFDIGEFEGRNWSLSLPQLADQSPPANTSLPISFTVSNNENNGANDVSVTAELEIFENNPSLPMLQNGEIISPNTFPADRRSVSMKQGSAQQLILNLPALPIGTHHGRVRLAGQDALGLDDVRYFSVKITPPSRLLVVSNSREESSVVSNAVTVNSEVASSPEYLTDEISFEDLPIVRMQNYSVVALIDPPPQDATYRLAEEYLNGGGRVLVCFGNQSQLQSSKGQWFQGTPRRWRSPDPGTFLQLVDSRHPALLSLSENVPWGNFRIQQYWRVEPNEKDGVMAIFAGTDHPAIIERQWVNNEQDDQQIGTLLMINTPFPAINEENQNWNRLFGTNAWPAWLLCRQMIEYLANRSTVANNTMVGNQFALRVKKSSNEDYSGKGFLFEPDNPTPSPILGLETSDYLRIREVSRAGTYWIRGKGLENGFSANLQENATSVKRIDPSTFDDRIGNDSYQIISDLDDLAVRQLKSARNIPLHSSTILVACAVLILEQIISNRFYATKFNKPATDKNLEKI